MNYIKINGKQKIVVYTDVACGNLKNSGSWGAYLIFRMGENYFCNLLSWQSKQLKHVAQCSLTAETIALLDGVETMVKINGKQKIVVYTDVAYGNLKNSGSWGAYLIFRMGENYFCNLLSWQSKQLKHVAQCSLTAETIALLDGVETALYIKELFKEIYKTGLSVKVYTDNQPLLD